MFVLLITHTNRLPNDINKEILIKIIFNDKITKNSFLQDSDEENPFDDDVGANVADFNEMKGDPTKLGMAPANKPF